MYLESQNCLAKDFWGNETSGQRLVGDVWYSTNYFADVARGIILRQPAAEPLYIHLNWSAAKNLRPHSAGVWI